MHIQKIIDAPFVREIAGMVGGALVAFLAYSAYQQVEGVLSATLLSPSQVETEDRALAMQRAAHVRAIALRVREILAEKQQAHALDPQGGAL